MLWESSPPCHVFRIFWGMTIYRTPYYCLGYIHTRRESLFSFLFFSFLTPLPLKQTQRHAAGGEGGRRRQQFVQRSCCLHMPVRLVSGLTDSTELMNHASEDRWVSGAVFRSHVRLWPHAAFPRRWYADVSLGSVRFPQLIYFTMALWKALVAATQSLPHSFTPPPPPHHILLSNILGLPIGSLI